MQDTETQRTVFVICTVVKGDFMELSSILAKSAGYGGETLDQHTREVVEKLEALRDLRPTLIDASAWRCLEWACFLHDTGKAAVGFQAMLRGGSKWSHRHEVLSLVFFDWIAPVLATCGICPSDVAFENTFLRFSRLADSPDVG